MKHRITALLTAAVLLLPVTGCTKQKKGATLEVDLTTSYASETLSNHGITYYPETVTPKGVICTREKKLKDTDLML